MRVLVVGGSGHTGRLVVGDLLRRGHDVVAAGRDRGSDRLEVAGGSVPHAALALPDDARLRGLLDGTDAVVNCAGPFADTALGVARVAVAAGAAYLDVSAEQAVTRELFEVLGAAAPARPVVPSAAFFGGLGDLVATAAADDWTAVDRVDLMIGLDSWLPTAGTRRTVTRNRGRHLTFQGGALRPPTGPDRTLTWDFGGALGRQPMTESHTADQITLPSHLATTEVAVFMNDRPVADLLDPATPPPVVTDEGHSGQRFAVAAVVTRGGEQRRLAVAGHDIYAVTAPLVGEAVDAVAGHPRAPGGVLALGALLDAPEVLRRLPLDLSATAGGQPG